MEMNLNDDFINQAELNNLFKFILTLLGKNPSDTYSTNISMIIDTNQISETNNKKDTDT